MNDFIVVELSVLILGFFGLCFVIVWKEHRNTMARKAENEAAKKNLEDESANHLKIMSRLSSIEKDVERIETKIDSIDAATSEFGFISGRNSREITLVKSKITESDPAETLG